MTELTFVLRSPVPFACDKNPNELFAWPVSPAMEEQIQHGLDLDIPVRCIMLEQGHFFTASGYVQAVESPLVVIRVDVNRAFPDIPVETVAYVEDQLTEDQASAVCLDLLG